VVADGQLRRSTDGGQTFPVAGQSPRAYCAGLDGTSVLACGVNILDGYSLGRSDDQGQTFTKVMSYADLGAPRCPNGTPTSDSCGPLYANLRSQLDQLEPPPAADMGGTPDGGPGPDAADAVSGGDGSPAADGSPGADVPAGQDVPAGHDRGVRDDSGGGKGDAGGGGGGGGCSVASVSGGRPVDLAGAAALLLVALGLFLSAGRCSRGSGRSSPAARRSTSGR
jgi:hypothetical protein